MRESTKPFALGLAEEGQILRIVSLRAGRNLAQRLTDLGLNVGTDIRVVQRAGTGLVLTRDTVRLAIGAGMAMKIMVVEADAP